LAEQENGDATTGWILLQMASTIHPPTAQNLNALRTARVSSFVGRDQVMTPHPVNYRPGQTGLKPTVVFAGVLLVGGAVAGLIAIRQPDMERIRLEERVRAVLPEPGAPAGGRLRDPLDERLEQIQRLQLTPGFEMLPDKTREEVRQVAEEWASHLESRREFHARVKEPYLATNEEEFARFEGQTRDFAFPTKYASEWADTSLAGRLDNVRRQYAQVRIAITDTVKWIADRSEEGERLDRKGLAEIIPRLRTADKEMKDQLTSVWFAAVAEYQRQSSYPPSRDEYIPGVNSFRYADLEKFSLVRNARNRWAKIRQDVGDTHEIIVRRAVD
jgi:hypothetical protein